MPAKITIQSGISAGASHWIEKSVIRIGSDPNCEVCLPSADVPPHALTVEYRDGQYRIYNRCQSTVVVGNHAVESGKAVIWPDSVVLQLNGDIKLVLNLDDDPTPAPTVSAIEPDDGIDKHDYEYKSELLNDSQPVAEVDETSGGGSKAVMQLAVIVFCLLGCIGLLARDSIKNKTSDGRKPPSFATTIRNANDSSETSPKLVQRLQFAESAAVRGNKKSARERFGKLRDDLLPQKAVFISNARKPELAILDFVEYRLGQLK